MKKNCFLLLFLILSHVGFAQRPIKDPKDTTGKDGKPVTVPISDMSNTITIPTGITPTQNNSANNGSTAVSIPNNNTQSLNLDELNKKVADLEQQVLRLQARINFSDFNVISYKVKAEDLTPSGNEKIKYKPEIRINHPLCNNNPDIKLFVQSDNGLNVSTFYRQGYWYIRTPLIYSETLMQYGIMDKYNITGYLGTFLNKDVTFENILSDGGILHGNYYSPNYDNGFTILVFKDLPNYNPAIYQKPTGQ